MTPEQELLAIIEQIRKTSFQDVPEDLVQQIATIEMDFTESRTEAYKRIEQVINAYLAKKEG